MPEARLNVRGSWQDYPYRYPQCRSRPGAIRRQSELGAGWLWSVPLPSYEITFPRSVAPSGLQGASSFNLAVKLVGKFYSGFHLLDVSIHVYFKSLKTRTIPSNVSRRNGRLSASSWSSTMLTLPSGVICSLKR